MLADLRILLQRNPDLLVREAFGLAALMVAILAGLFLPTIA